MPTASLPTFLAMAIPASYEGGASIVDIRNDEIHFSILGEMQRTLRPAAGEGKRLPTLLLYDEKGLRLFEDITYLEEYYLTNSEIEVLHHHADRIAERIEEGTQLIELGSGYDPITTPSPSRSCIFELQYLSLTQAGESWVADRTPAIFVRSPFYYKLSKRRGKRLITTLWTSPYQNYTGRCPRSPLVDSSTCVSTGF